MTLNIAADVNDASRGQRLLHCAGYARNPERLYHRAGSGGSAFGDNMYFGYALGTSTDFFDWNVVRTDVLTRLATLNTALARQAALGPLR